MRLLLIAGAVLTAVLAGPAAAQQWPTRSVRLIVPYIAATRLQPMI